MKIALVFWGDFPEGSGPARRLFLVGKGLAWLGHEVHFVVPQRFEPGPLFQVRDGISIHWGTITTRATWNRYSERLAARLAGLRLLYNLASKGLGWLILSNPSLDGLPLLLIARQYKARVAATYDDLRSWPRRPTPEDRLRMLWLESADRVIPKLTQLNLATSQFLEQRVRSIAPQTPIFLFPPVMDPELFKNEPTRAAAFRSKWNLGSTIVVAYLGTYWNVEGVSILLQAVSKLARDGERFKLVISGTASLGLDCDDVSQLIQELGLENIVTETGWLFTDEVVAAMSAADILVVPKLNDIANVAGMPAKLAEYLAIGGAVVVSRVGDIPLYVTDHENALLCEPGDAGSLAEALRQLIHDVSLRRKLSMNAPLVARKHFDYRQVVARLESAMVAESGKEYHSK